MFHITRLGDKLTVGANTSLPWSFYSLPLSALLLARSSRACFSSLRLHRCINFKANPGSESACASRTTIGWHQITVSKLRAGFFRQSCKAWWKHPFVDKWSFLECTYILVIFPWGCYFAHPIYDVTKNSIPCLWLSVKCKISVNILCEGLFYRTEWWKRSFFQKEYFVAHKTRVQKPYPVYDQYDQNRYPIYYQKL